MSFNYKILILYILLGLTNMDSTAQNLEFQSTTGGGTFAQAYAEVGGKPYLLAGIGGQFVVFDVQNAAGPKPLGRLQLSGTVNSIAIQDSRAYVAVQSAGFSILDLANPQKPTVLKTISGGFSDLHIVNGSLYATYSRGTIVSGQYKILTRLMVFDLADPLNPVEKVATELEGWENAFSIRDSLLYRPSGRWLEVVKISNPDSLHVIYKAELITNMPSTSEFSDILLHDSVAYVSTQSLGIVRVLMTYPEQPLAKGSFGNKQYYRSLLKVGGYLYAAYNSGVEIYDISDPYNPAIVDTLRAASAQNLALGASQVYLSQPLTGIRVYDVSTPGNPGFVSTVTEPSSVHSLAVSGRYAFAADGRRFSVYDIGDLSLMAPVKAMGDYGTVSKVMVSGGYAYLLGESGMAVFDISTPQAPTQAALFDSAGWSQDLAIRDSLVFIADKRGALRSVDVSTPAAPRLISKLDVGAGAVAVALSGKKVWLGRLDSSVLIIDAANASQLAAVDSFKVPGKVVHIALDDSLAVVALGYRGAAIFRLREGQTPESLYVYRSTAGYTRHATFYRNYAFLCHSSAGVEIVDLKDPAQPRKHGAYGTPGNAAQSAWVGPTLFIADGGLIALKALGLPDVQNPDVPHTVSLLYPRKVFPHSGNNPPIFRLDGRRIIRPLPRRVRDWPYRSLSPRDGFYRTSGSPPAER